MIESVVSCNIDHKYLPLFLFSSVLSTSSLVDKTGFALTNERWAETVCITSKKKLGEPMCESTCSFSLCHETRDISKRGGSISLDLGVDECGVMLPLTFAKVLQLCPTLCNPMDCSQPGSSVHGILQARILEWVAMPSSRGSSRPRDQTHISHISCTGKQVLYHWATWEAADIWGLL